MNQRTFILLLIYGVVSVAALMFMKFGTAGSGLKLPPPWRPLILVGIGGTLYMISLSVWLLILAGSKLTVVFPLAVGLTVLGTTVASIMLLGESITVTRLIGTLLILIGAIVITR